jgi:hypothetical protein
MQERIKMDDKDKLTEVMATLALNDLKRRERLLKIVRGPSEWRLWIYGIGISALIIFASYRTKENTLAPALIPLVFGVVAAFQDISKRMDALIELIGEDRLRNPKRNDDA